MIKPLSLSALCECFGGDLINSDYAFSSISTDTRSVNSGDVFVALKGPRFDAHDYVHDAVAAGAAAIVVDHRIDTLSVPQWIVSDTTIALGDIARLQRENFAGDLVAITGSSGKTTVKGMLLSIFQYAFGRASVFATHGNLNNHIGVPLSLLSLTDQHQYAVIEMGASGMDEIAYLTHMAKPQVALVNNVMSAHVEGFGSIDNIAIAKGEIYDSLRYDGVAIINADDTYASQWLSQNAHRTCITFSTDKNTSADIFAENITLNKKGCAEFSLSLKDKVLPVSLRVLGAHNVANAIAAVACAYAVNVDPQKIVAGLQAYNGDAGRLQLFEGYRQALVIDDAYNANPGSVAAAIDVLASMSGETVLVLGDMGELGADSQELHKAVGRYALEKNIQHVVAFGELAGLAAESFGSQSCFLDMTQLIQYVKDKANNNMVFLIKGSRSARMGKGS